MTELSLRIRREAWELIKTRRLGRCIGVSSLVATGVCKTSEKQILEMANNGAILCSTNLIIARIPWSEDFFGEVGKKILDFSRYRKKILAFII